VPCAAIRRSLVPRSHGWCSSACGSTPFTNRKQRRDELLGRFGTGPRGFWPEPWPRRRPRLAECGDERARGRRLFGDERDRTAIGLGASKGPRRRSSRRPRYGREEVRAGVDELFAAGLLGRHVAGVPHTKPVGRERKRESVGATHLRQAEVEHLIRRSSREHIGPGLRSRCTTPAACAAPSAPAIARRIRMAAPTGSRPCTSARPASLSVQELEGEIGDLRASLATSRIRITFGWATFAPPRLSTQPLDRAGVRDAVRAQDLHRDALAIGRRSPRRPRSSTRHRSS